MATKRTLGEPAQDSVQPVEVETLESVTPKDIDEGDSDRGVETNDQEAESPSDLSSTEEQDPELFTVFSLDDLKAAVKTAAILMCAVGLVSIVAFLNVGLWFFRLGQRFKEFVVEADGALREAIEEEASRSLNRSLAGLSATVRHLFPVIDAEAPGAAED